MGNTFKFKQFEIKQDQSAHKVGTDSMVLGAWTAGDFDKILDIGTGTGILALMMAQKFPKANITAIEPNSDAFKEAVSNFKNSPFRDKILGIQSKLQEFGSLEKFDLIISNPPYYNATYLSGDTARDQARHATELPVHEFYEFAVDLLSEDGRLNVVVPFTEEQEHIERAFDNELFIQEILHTLTPKGTKKRSLISFGFSDIQPKQVELMIKDENNRYSTDYIELTQAFHFNQLERE